MEREGAAKSRIDLIKNQLEMERDLKMVEAEEKQNLKTEKSLQAQYVKMEQVQKSGSKQR